MSTKNNMEFWKAEDGQSINISRQYASTLSEVWDAWTVAEILDQWWAPKPWKCETKRLDLNEGGRWHYSMRGPAGEISWSLFDFEKIAPLSYLAGKVSFCNENEVVQSELASMFWHTEFKENEEGTLVHIKIEGTSENDLQNLLDMGFREGFEMGLNNLEKWLDKPTNKLSYSTK